MADNVEISAGTGTTIAADDVGGGVLVQRVKVTWGADGTANDASAANPLPVVQTGALPAGTAAIGKLAANSGVDIGDVDVTSLPALVAGTAIIGKVGIDQTTPGTTNAVDTELPAAAALADAASNPTTPMIGAALLGYNGASWDRVRVQNVRKDVSAVTITTIATVWTPASGKKFRLMGGSISVSAACNVLFEDNSAGAGNFVWRTPKLLADTPYNFDLGNGKLSATADQVLKATSSAAATITGTLYGCEE